MSAFHAASKNETSLHAVIVAYARAPALLITGTTNLVFAVLAGASY